ncbi:protein of unknown function [Xenorhabdus poinarii G6]|uniref:Uncharacterized protein n=1 Tax=Xenorhabdus poinarii G6 TaxID=1354304 RepID=A0A068R5J4_9GAMM|nr:protein of unknown function [Xenorhabdus poinarii G6]
MSGKQYVFMSTIINNNKALHKNIIITKSTFIEIASNFVINNILVTFSFLIS